jgi:very-short-patch-repair endonuclease
MSPAGQRTRNHAKRMRRDPAYTERVLWRLLRNRRLEALKFRRQVPLGPYVADFVCFEHRLVVEADGPLHAERLDHDAARDAWLQGQRFQVLRFHNDLIMLDPDRVLGEIPWRAGLA